MPSDERWAQIVVVGADGTTVHYSLLGPGRPTIDIVGLVARLVLAAKRSGTRLTIEQVNSDLFELLELAGLGLEVQREPEGGEQAVGVEE